MVGLEALALAEQYWGKGDLFSHELDKARISCWDYLDSNYVPANPTEQRDCAIRALICVLYPDPPSEDISELTECFFEFIALIGVYYTAIEDAVSTMIEL